MRCCDAAGGANIKRISFECENMGEICEKCLREESGKRSDMLMANSCLWGGSLGKKLLKR